MADDDWRKRFARQINGNPLLQAAALGIGVAILGLSYGAANSTPEKRSRFKERMRAQREDMERAKRESELRHRLRKEYFETGEGKALFEQQAYVVIPAGRPYPDARFETTDSGMGFEASSMSAGLKLSLEYDFRDAIRSVHMSRRGGPHRYGYGGTSGSMLLISPQSPDASRDFDGWIDDTRLMAGLIAAPGSPYARIRLRRPNTSEINERLWIEHLRRNPDIAAATGEEWLLRR